MSAAVGMRESEGKVGSCTQCQGDIMSHKVYREMKIDITLCSQNTRQVHIPLKVQNFSSGLNNIASKDSEFHKVLRTCKESAEDPGSNFRL
jgi:hypothetical protein